MSFAEGQPSRLQQVLGSGDQGALFQTVTSGKEGEVGRAS